MAEFFVYFLRSTTTGHFYVGSTGDAVNRIQRHFDELLSGRHHNHNVQALWNDGIRFSVDQHSYPTLESARQAEYQVIESNKSNPYLLNISLGVNGGDNLTRNPNRDDIIGRMTVNLRKTISEMTPEQRRQLHSQPGEQNGMFGRTHTAEARAKISKANKEREHRRGFTLADSTKSKISEAAKLRTGDKNPFFGKQHSEETRLKMSAERKQRYASSTKPHPGSVPVIVDGVQYASSMDACRTLGIERSLFGHRLRSKSEKYSNYQYLDKSPTTTESTSSDGSE